MEFHDFPIKCAFPRRTLRIINIPKEILMISRGPISRNHENPTFSVKSHFWCKKQLPSHFHFLMKFMEISWKTAFRRNWRLPRSECSLSFPWYSEGVPRAARKSWNSVDFTWFSRNSTPLLAFCAMKRQAHHTPAPSSRFSPFAETVVIHMVFAREIHPNR